MLIGSGEPIRPLRAKPGRPADVSHAIARLKMLRTR
jgi:hypothetical protein